MAYGQNVSSCDPLIIVIIPFNYDMKLPEAKTLSAIRL